MDTPTAAPYLSATEIAKHIRTALRQAFPGVKFSVRSDYYSQGSSVRVRWEDGPAEAIVDQRLNQFRGKFFDGQDDSTHYAPIAIDGQAFRCGAYIDASRRLSEAGRELRDRLIVDRQRQDERENPWRLEARLCFTASGYLLASVKR
jgi:hypothetical protein